MRLRRNALPAETIRVFLAVVDDRPVDSCILCAGDAAACRARGCTFVSAWATADMLELIMPGSGAFAIARERMRQIEGEGHTEAHDDAHANGELALASSCYAAPVSIYRVMPAIVDGVLFANPWPFEPRYDRRSRTRDAFDLLPKSGAFAAAEYDRLTRATARGSDPNPTHKPPQES